MAKTAHSRVSRRDWKLYITQAGAQAGPHRPLRSNHRQGNVEISLFFPRSKRTACVRAAHKHTVCVRESAIRGMFGIESSVFVGFEGICVHVCVSVPQFAAYTQTWPQDPVGNS